MPSMRISVLSWQEKFKKSFSSSLMKLSGLIAVKSTARSAQWKQHSPIVAQPSVYPFRPARCTITKRKHLGSHTSHNLRSVHALTCWTQRLNSQDKLMRIQAFDHATYVWVSNYNRGLYNYTNIIIIGNPPPDYRYTSHTKHCFVLRFSSYFRFCQLQFDAHSYTAPAMNSRRPPNSWGSRQDIMRWLHGRTFLSDSSPTHYKVVFTVSTNR